MEKFLILVFNSGISEDRLDLIYKIVKCYQSRILILSPIDRNLIKKIASNEGVKENEVRDRLVHDIYMHLYHLEEKFKKEALDVTVSTKEIAQYEDFVQEIKKINPKMLFIVGPIENSIFEAIRETLTVPLLLLPAEEK
jgi:hypothetical protein